MPQVSRMRRCRMGPPQASCLRPACLRSARERETMHGWAAVSLSRARSSASDSAAPPQQSSFDRAAPPQQSSVARTRGLKLPAGRRLQQTLPRSSGRDRRRGAHV
eukprot:scaffold93067_cov66-Phaeocystis_antarctica.AAC.2